MGELARENDGLRDELVGTQAAMEVERQQAQGDLQVRHQSEPRGERVWGDGRGGGSPTHLPTTIQAHQQHIAELRAENDELHAELAQEQARAEEERQRTQVDVHVRIGYACMREGEEEGRDGVSTKEEAHTSHLPQVHVARLRRLDVENKRLGQQLEAEHEAAELMRQEREKDARVSRRKRRRRSGEAEERS